LSDSEPFGEFRGPGFEATFREQLRCLQVNLALTLARP
jgi:hypothetical protein